MRSRSKKREQQEREYARIREEYILAHPRCECVPCRRFATEIHHLAGRSGKRLTDTDNFMAVCAACHHERIHSNPKWAYEKGYLKRR